MQKKIAKEKPGACFVGTHHGHWSQSKTLGWIKQPDRGQADKINCHIVRFHVNIQSELVATGNDSVPVLGY